MCIHGEEKIDISGQILNRPKLNTNVECFLYTSHLCTNEIKLDPYWGSSEKIGGVTNGQTLTQAVW